MIYFTAHTFKCVCHCKRAMFRVLGMYNFDAFPGVATAKQSLFYYLTKVVHVFIKHQTKIEKKQYHVQRKKY